MLLKSTQIICSGTRLATITERNYKITENNPLLKEIVEKLITAELNESVLIDEDTLEKNFLTVLRPIAQKYKKNIQTQPKTKKERVQKPDISIGMGEILIELKILKDLNDLYRLFYQTIKYLKITQSVLILFIWDKNNVFKNEDKEDLKSLEQPSKILKIVKRI